MSFNNSAWRWTGVFAALFLMSQNLWFGDAAIHPGPGHFPLHIYSVYLMIGGCALLTPIISLYGFKREENTPEDCFLAQRRVGTLVLFFTSVATNFSAFFFLGFAGAGYCIGYSYCGMMAGRRLAGQPA